MELPPTTFNAYCFSNLNKISKENILNEIELYNITKKDKKQLKSLINKVEKYNPLLLDKYCYPKNKKTSFLLLCIIGNFKNKYKDEILQKDVETLEYFASKVETNEYKENDYLDICSNLKTDTIITDFFEKVCYCCSKYEFIDGSLCISSVNDL